MSLFGHGAVKATVHHPQQSFMRTSERPESILCGHFVPVAEPGCGRGLLEGEVV
jgi:hypothetical protein